MESVQLIVYRDKEDYLAHHGVKGQQWGIRRYQNPDGSLTPEGREKYGESQRGYEARKMYKAGPITKEQRREGTKAKNIIGKIDNVMNLGFGRRMREFEQRHKKGIAAATAALGIAGTVAVGVLTGGSAPAIVSAGSKAVGALIGTGVRLGVTNNLMLKYGYNRTGKEAIRDIKGTAKEYVNA